MKRHLLLGILAALAVALAAADGSASNQKRWGAGYFPNLPVQTQDGKTLHFWDDLIKDKVVVISFIYTSCTDLCPLTTARMAELRDLFGESMGRDVHFISLTVDPENDTPARMKLFADAYRAGDDPGWRFVTGKPEHIRQINRKLGDRSAERGLASHRNEIVIGNGATADWSRANLFNDLQEVAHSIRAMDAKWADRSRTAHSGHGQMKVVEMENNPGEILFKKACAACHTIGVGDHVGPDLRGVTERRDEQWLTRFLVDPVRMRASGDPALAELVERFPGVRMPLIGLSPTDAGDLISYLRMRNEKLEQASLEGAEAADPAAHHHHHGQHQHGHHHRH